MLDSMRYPKNKQITGAAESIYQILSGYSTDLSHIRVPHSAQTFNQFTFKSNGEWSSGVPTANGIVELIVDFSSTPTGTIETIICYDAYLEISRNSVIFRSDV